MEQVNVNLENNVNEICDQAAENADRYISISDNVPEIINGSTVFIEGA